MSYNTWPTFAGRGWNIKKRPITRTIIETADGGQEFRLARFQNPLYEFDVEIPYLSRADYATLQTFFAQQSGPLTPFLIAPDNDSSVSAQEFFTGDGVTTKATLVMPDGSPALVANSGATPTVSAIHQTDWQGRIALSNQPRTNLCMQSNNFSAWAAYFVIPASLSSGEPDPSGGSSAWSFALSDATGSGSRCGLVQTGATQSTPVVAGLWMRADVAGMKVGIASLTGSAGFLQTLTTQWVYYQVACPVGNQPPRIFCITLAAGDNPGIPSATRMHFFAAMAVPGTQTTGAYIPTTSAPVTVTDYAQAGNQVTFGQVPAVGAVEDWDGTYAYLVRFKDDQIEMTQTMNQVYEATTITLRSVR